MPSFWTQFKIHFLAETLSKVLFSGKSPKLSALAFAVFIGFVLLLKWTIKCIFWCLTFPLQTKRAKIRRSMKKVSKLATKHGDIASPIVRIGSNLGIMIDGRNWRNGIRRIAYQANPQTGFVSIVVFGNAFSFEADYSFLRLHCGIPEDFEITYERLFEIHQKIRANFL